MIVCPECGTRNPPGTQFCGECGTFLEWAGDEPAKTAAATTQTARGGGTTTAEPVSPPAPDTVLPPKPPEPAKPVVDEAPRPPQPRPEPLAPRPPEPAPKPVEEAAPDTGIRLVQPDAKQRRYTPVVTDEPETETPGDIECANCGVGNLATRKFCRSCGHLLARPVGEKKKSWWRRLWDKIRGKGRRYDAGTRRVQRGRSMLPRLIAVLAVIGLVVAAFTILPTKVYLQRAITAVRDRTGDPAPVRAKEIHASTSIYGADPTLVADSVSNKFWSPTRPFAGNWIESSFDQPVRLLNVIVTAGISKDQKKFITEGRPRDIVITTTNEDNETKAFPLVVQDKPDQQIFEVKVSNVKKVRLTIISCYDDKKTFCAVGELEFRKRG